MKLRICLIGMLALALLVVSGCSWVDDVKLFKGGEEEVVPPAEESLASEEAAIPEATEPPPVEPAPTPEEISPDSRQIVLYFASADGTSLEAETRVIPKQEGIARATMAQLISGPQQTDLSPTLPSTTTLDGINISDGVCTVDFSAEFLEHMPADSSSQLLALYSVVNTLTQFDTVDYVRILVDGQSLSATIGGVDVSAALAPAMF